MPSTTNLSHRLAQWLIEQRLALFIVTLLILGGTSLGLAKLQVTTDYKIFFDRDNPQLVAYEDIQNTFTKSENILFILAPHNNNVFTNDNLAAIDWLTEQAWKLPYSARVESLNNFQHTEAVDEDLLVGDLVEGPYDKSIQQLDILRDIALNEPLLVKRLVSSQGHVAAVDVVLQLPEDQTEALRQLMPIVRDLEQQFLTRYPAFDTHIGGVATFNYAFDESTTRDSMTLVPLMLVIILALVAMMLRSPSGMLITLIVMITGVMATFGIVGLLGVKLNNINVTTPVIILTLAVADCVHLLSLYLQSLKRGMSKIEAMKHSLDINLKAVFLTSFTTAVGFLSMNFSDSPPFRELGSMSALGVLFTFLFSLTLLPQLAIWLTRKPPQTDLEHTSSFARMADFTINNHRWLLPATLLVAVACMAFIPNNSLNDDNVNYFSKNLPVRQAADFAAEHLGGLNLIEYKLDTQTSNGIFEPAYLAKVSAFAEWLRAQPEINHVYSFTDIMKRLNKNMHNDDPAYMQLPTSRELSAQYALLYELSLPFGMDLNNQINLSKSALRITATIKNIKAKELLELEQRAQDWMTQHASELRSPGASPSIMFAHIGQRNIESMIWGTALAVLIISATLIVSLGSWKLGVLSIVPNAFPALMTFGIWGAVVSEVNLAVAVIFSITLGIVVDDTVHFLTKYLRARQVQGASVRDAIHFAFEHVGAALLTTTIVLAIGFSTLALSDFNVNSTMGIMVAMTIVIALIFDLLFLPSLLLMGERFANRAESSDTARPINPQPATSHNL